MKQRRTHLLPAVAMSCIALALCASWLHAQESRQGSVDVFLVGSEEAGSTGRLVIGELRALGDAAEEHPLEILVAEVDGAAVAGKQLKLATGSLPAGLYRGLLLIAPPVEGAEPPEPRELSLAQDFRVRPGESTTLLLDWNRRDPFAQAADRALSLRRAPETVRRLTLYVTDEKSDRVVAVNRGTERVFGNIPVGKRPRGLDVSPLGRQVFVANSGDDTISVIDPSSHRVVDTLVVRAGCRPEDVAVGQDGQRVVVSCAGLNVLVVFDPFANAELGEIGLSRSPGRLAASRDGRTVYALAPEGNQVVAVDLGRITGPPRTVTVEAQPSDLAVDPRTGRLFVTHAHAPLVSVIGPDMRLEGTLQVGAPSRGIAVERDGRRVYLSGGPAGGLSLVGADVGTVIRRWPFPEGYYIALDPDGRKVFVTSGKRGKLWVLDRIAGRLTTRLPIGASAADLVLVP